MNLTGEHMAALEVTDLENNVRCIKLGGRLDIQGTGELETPFTAKSATSKSKIIVDISNVEFMASIGIRLLLSSAKAQDRRGGKMILLNPQPLVEETLKVAGIDKLIPVYNDFAQATEYLNTTVS
jgi:anti-sigma B factor antagonist